MGVFSNKIGPYMDVENTDVRTDLAKGENKTWYTEWTRNGHGHEVLGTSISTFGSNADKTAKLYTDSDTSNSHGSIRTVSADMSAVTGSTADANKPCISSTSLL